MKEKTTTVVLALLGFLWIALASFGFALLLSGCAESPAPTPDTDASTLPAPEPFPAELWAAVQLEHPTPCIPPDVQRLTHADFESLLGICGGGACNAACARCSSAEPFEGRLVVTTSTSDAILVGEAFRAIATCEGAPFDTNGYLDVVNALEAP